MSTAVENRTAVMALLSAAGANPYTLGQLAKMSTKPAQYCEVYVTERVGEVRMSGGRSSQRSWLVQVRAVAQLEDNAEKVREKVRDALEERTVTVGGVESTPIAAGPQDPIAPDSGWFSGLGDFTYHL